MIRQIFTQVKFINDSNLSPPTIETIEVPANENIAFFSSIYYPIKDILPYILPSIYYPITLQRHWFNQIVKKKFK